VVRAVTAVVGRRRVSVSVSRRGIQCVQEKQLLSFFQRGQKLKLTKIV
jgi:hypothetical protein